MAAKPAPKSSWLRSSSMPVNQHPASMPIDSSSEVINPTPYHALSSYARGPQALSERFQIAQMICCTLLELKGEFGDIAIGGR